MKKILALICSWGITLLGSKTTDCNGGFKISCSPKSHFARIGEKIVFTITANKKIPCTITLTVDGGRVLKELKNVKTPQTVSWITEFPGFIRCSVRAEGVKADSAVAVEPEKIKAVGREPDDFDAFWKKTLEEAEKLPLDLQEQKLDLEGHYNYSIISCANINGKRAYGLLAIPRKIKKPVAMLVRFGGGEAYYSVDELLDCVKETQKNLKRQAAVLLLHLPPYAPEKDDKTAAERHKKFLEELGGVKRYIFYQADKKETYYARSAVTGCLRLLDHAANLKEIDKENIVFAGASHGGKLGAYLACFSPHIKAAFCGVPSACEFHSITDNRSSSLPEELKECLEAVNYYDLVWFARRIKIPLFISVGFVDTACPPTGVYAFYNELKCPKQLYNKTRHGHAGAPPDYGPQTWQFLADHLSR